MAAPAPVERCLTLADKAYFKLWKYSSIESLGGMVNDYDLVGKVLPITDEIGLFGSERFSLMGATKRQTKVKVKH